MTPRLAVAIVLSLALADTPASYRAEIARYRSARLAELTAPNGWLAVRGLFWLHEGANVAGRTALAPRASSSGR